MSARLVTAGESVVALSDASIIGTTATIATLDIKCTLDASLATTTVLSRGCRIISDRSRIILRRRVIIYF